MIEAIGIATGLRAKPSKRNYQVSNMLLKQGYTPEQIKLLGPDGIWFQTVKPFGKKSNPLHRGQLLQYIKQCLEWHENPTEREMTEYEFAARQRSQTQPESKVSQPDKPDKPDKPKFKTVHF
jgi:hypothetical protein